MGALSVTQRNTALVRALFGQFCNAVGHADTQKGTVACPADYGISYSGTFYDGSRALAKFVYGASGCQTVSITADGKTQWTYDSGLPIYSAPAIGNGVMVFGIGDVFGDPHKGGVVALSTRNGSVLWILDLHNAVFSAPAIAGETVLFGDARGDVIAFRPG